MLEKPKNYEEAKKIIVECESDKQFVGKYRNAISLKAAFVTAVGVMCSYAAGLISGEPELTQSLLPLAGTVGLMFWLPIVGEIKTNIEARNGTIFNKLTEKQVMDIAERFVDEYNELEAKRERKGR